MKEESKKIREILELYVKSSGSDEDKESILKLMDTDDSEYILYEESLRFWDEINPDQYKPDFKSEHILDRIHHDINLEEGEFMTKTKPNIRFISYLTRIAAILVIPLLITSLLFYSQNRSFKNSVSLTEIHAPFGSRVSFSLPDGSTGRLNSGSSLKFPNQFSGKVRSVELTGEAYFDAVSNLRKPLIVSTENIDVKVLGTSFNVRAYSDEQTMEITLERGEVEVIKKTNNNIRSIGVLKPSESFVYNSISDTSEIESVNIDEKLSWLYGKLTFKYEPFEEVVRKINRWYNVNIVIKDERLHSYIYYGTFQDETLDEVLNLLHHTAPIRYRDIPREKNKDGEFEKRKIEIYCKK